MSTRREYSKPIVRVYGDVALVTRNKRVAGCQDQFNASPNQISHEAQGCVDSSIHLNFDLSFGSQ
jgi:hypothetical protein